MRDKVSFRTVGNLVKFFKDGNNNVSNPTMKTNKRHSFNADKEDDQPTLDSKLTRKIGQIRSIFQDSNATILAAQTITSAADDIELILNNDSGKENYDSADDGNSNSFNITNISAVQRDDSPTIMSLTMSKTFESPIDCDDLYGSAYSRSRSKSFVRTHQQSNNEPYSHWIETKRKSIQKSKSFAAPTSVIKQFDEQLCTPSIVEPITSVIMENRAQKCVGKTMETDNPNSVDNRSAAAVLENKFAKHFGCPAKDSQKTATKDNNEKITSKSTSSTVKKSHDLPHLKFTNVSTSVNSENTEVAPKLSPSVARSNSNRSQKSLIDPRYTKFFGVFANEPLSPLSDGQFICLQSARSSKVCFSSMDEADVAFDDLYNSYKITDDELQVAEQAFEIVYLGAVKIQVFVSFFFFFDKKKKWLKGGLWE